MIEIFYAPLGPVHQYFGPIAIIVFRYYLFKIRVFNLDQDFVQKPSVNLMEFFEVFNIKILFYI